MMNRQHMLDKEQLRAEFKQRYEKLQDYERQEYLTVISGLKLEL